MSRYHWWITSILIVSAVVAGRPRSSFLKSTIPAPTPTSPTPSTTPAPGANWSTVWSTNLQAQCARTDFGVLCNNVPWWLGLIHPKSGETLWNITAPTFDNINGTQLYFPVSLTKEIIYIAGYGINIKTGKVLWQEQVTSGCTNGLFVVADGPSNFVVTCTRQTLDMTLFLDTFSIFVSNGTALFHISKNVTNVSYQGAVAVSHHAIVCQYGLDFYAVDSQSGKQLWTYTPSLLNADMFPISAPAADAFVLTYGNNVTALAYEDGSVLWSQSNFLNLEYGCQSIAYVNDPQTKNASREVIVWVGWNGTLIFTESRTGTTAFQTTVWTSDTTIACAFAVNDAYVWTSSGSNFTAISLTTLEVEWTTLVPLPYSFDIIHVGSPTNRDPYVRHLEGNLIRLHDGGIQHKFLVPLQVEGVQVAQYDDDGVVVLNTDAGLVAYKLPR